MNFIFTVNEVSKKTGDYASLSVIDIKVLALTLELEVESKGNSDHLEFNPKRPETVFNGKIDRGNLDGFYVPSEQV